MIYMVGIEVIREQGTDLIVKVEADSLDEARSKARAAVFKKCRQTIVSDSLFASDPYWEDCGVSVGGDSQEEFDDKWTPDLDLTKV